MRRPLVMIVIIIVIIIVGLLDTHSPAANHFELAAQGESVWPCPILRYASLSDSFLPSSHAANMAVPTSAKSECSVMKR